MSKTQKIQVGKVIRTKVKMDDLIPKAEAAEILNVHPNTLANMQARGAITRYLLGGDKTYYNRAEIERYAKSEQ